MASRHQGNQIANTIAGLIPGKQRIGKDLSQPIYMRAETATYVIEKIVGNGTFGVVLKGYEEKTHDVIAIKRVLQDRRYKNRELQIMRRLRHPAIIDLKNYFYANGNNDEVYLNIVMDYMPETISRLYKEYIKRGTLFPVNLIKLYMFQLCRALAYMHFSSVCHRDIKPQNLLVDTTTGRLKLIDFGCAKELRPTEANIAYICSRYYRAPELVFGATIYTTAVDIWSMACVMAELFKGQPLFPGESGVDQMFEFIKVIGAPSEEQVAAMSKTYSSSKFPKIKAKPWETIFNTKYVPSDAIDLMAKVLVYEPAKRPTAIELCAHPFFASLADPAMKLPNGRPLPKELFEYTPEEIKFAMAKGVLEKLPGYDPEKVSAVVGTPGEDSAKM